MYYHMVVAIDGSEHSKKVVEDAITIAKAMKTRLIELVHVIDESELGSVAFRTEESLKNDPIVEKQLEPFVTLFEKATVPVQVVKLQGSPAKVIADYVEDQRADVVVIGSRGAGNIERFVLGSVSQKVVNRVHCAVHIVK